MWKMRETGRLEIESIESSHRQMAPDGSSFPWWISGVIFNPPVQYKWIIQKKSTRGSSVKNVQMAHDSKFNDNWREIGNSVMDSMMSMRCYFQSAHPMPMNDEGQCRAQAFRILQIGWGWWSEIGNHVIDVLFWMKQAWAVALVLVVRVLAAPGRSDEAAGPGPRRPQRHLRQHGHPAAGQRHRGGPAHLPPRKDPPFIGLIHSRQLTGLEPYSIRIESGLNRNWESSS